MSRFGWGDTPLYAQAAASDATFIAAPGVGHYVWITDIHISCGSDTTITITDEDDTVLFPASSVASMANLAAPILVSANKGVKVVKTGANAAAVFVGYFVNDAD